MKVLTRLLIGCLVGLLAMVEARSASAFPRLFGARRAQAGADNRDQRPASPKRQRSIKPEHRWTRPSEGRGPTGCEG